MLDLWHIERNQKQMLAFGHLLGMQLKTIGMNFIMFYTMHQHSLYVLQCVVSKTFENEFKLNAY